MSLHHPNVQGEENSFFNVCHLSDFKPKSCSVKSDALCCSLEVNSLCLSCLEILNVATDIHGFSQSVFFSLRVITTDCRTVPVIRVFPAGWFAVGTGLGWSLSGRTVCLGRFH